MSPQMQQQQQQQYPQQQQQTFHQKTSSDSSAIFEKVPPPTQDLPNITPMRRGRPTKTDSPPPPTTTEKQSSFDPFDPKHVKSNSIPKTAGFQNSFTPESIPPRVQSAPISQNSSPKPKMATKILQTQPSSPMKEPKKPERTSNIKKLMDELVLKEEVEDEGVSEDSPKMNRGVSSSIEARFNAIKHASRNSTPIKPSPTNSTSNSIPKKNKPAPPPKPARFRSAATTHSAVPDVDDFEHKFPSLEDLDKST